MKPRITATAFKTFLSKYLNLSQSRDITITSHGKPKAVLLSYERFKELTEYEKC